MSKFLSKEISKSLSKPTSQLLSPMETEGGKTIKRYIGKRGYILKKSHYDLETIQKLRERLTVKPMVNVDYCGPPEPFPVYRESNEKFYMPKFFGVKEIGPAEANILPFGLDIELTVSENFETRPNQLAPIQVAYDTLTTVGGGILSLGTGYGKTNIALYLIQKLKKKALIIVHKEFLMNQWIERIEQFLPGARVGKVQGDKIEIDDKDIVIGMLQSISSKTYALDAFDSFGIVVIDECHRIPCQHFSKALLKINCRMMLGLSATPTRDDGLTKILKWYIGEIIYEGLNENIKNVEVKRYVIYSDNEDYKKEIMTPRHAPMLPKMINNIVEYDIRNQFIISLIRDLIEEKRQILLLSDRRLHLETIKAMVEEEKICKVGYYMGGMKQGDLKESEGMDLILGTYSMAAEGMDIPSLNTLILASPKSKITQAVGRIIRKKHVDVSPLVVDLVDKFSIFSGQGNKRMTFYKKTGYPVSNYKVDLSPEEINIDFQETVLPKAPKTKLDDESPDSHGIVKKIKNSIDKDHGKVKFGFSSKNSPKNE
jgi:superfamily II DNA or RNA helicase